MAVKVEAADLGGHYDLAIVVCGYEARSRFLAESAALDAEHKIAFGYRSHEVLSFDENVQALAEAGFEILSVEDNQFAQAFSNLVERVAGPARAPISVLLDISCLTRNRLATILETLMSLDEMTLDVFYSLAEFSPPPAEEPPFEHLRPVSSNVGGWSGDASRAVVLITGLGYEQMKALGIIEYLDSYENWLFFPQSPIRRYDQEVRRANELLLRETPASNVIDYPVLDAAVLVRKLFGLVESLRREYRCMIMPLGPKIFAFASLLAGTAYSDVSVWRASAGKFAVPIEKHPSRHSAVFRVLWESTRVEE